jgi:hypothetical protein
MVSGLGEHNIMAEGSREAECSSHGGQVEQRENARSIWFSYFSLLLHLTPNLWDGASYIQGVLPSYLIPPGNALTHMFTGVLY